MKHLLILAGLLWVGLAVTACDQSGAPRQGDGEHGDSSAAGQGENVDGAFARGPHGGRLLVDGSFSMELAIFETGVPPEFRVWAYDAGVPVPPDRLTLTITLTRLGGVEDRIRFEPSGDFLRGDTVVYEPHSFLVSVEARHANASHRWRYENFEGRTRIDQEMAAALGLETELAGAATLRETVSVFGRIAPDAERVRQISARFPGRVASVKVSVGDRVSAGETLATIESNESLTFYTVTAPIDGVVTARNAHPGEQADRGPLFSLLDSSRVWVELAVFPRDMPRVEIGMPVEVLLADGTTRRRGQLSYIDPMAGADQSVVVRATLGNEDGVLVPGAFVTGRIEVAQYEVPLAVRRIGLQSFRDFTVVYAQVADEYEVRMLDLGRQDQEWVEVLGGLDPGTRYVTRNSYLVKADIEKSGAAHDH